MRKNAYETNKTDISFYEQCKWLTSERKGNSWYGRVNHAASQLTIKRLDRAFKSFFTRVKTEETVGYPRFKGKSQFSSLKYKYGNGCKLKNSRFYLQHIGNIKIINHRPIEGVIKTASVMVKNGKWYVSFACELPSVVKVPSNKPSAGIDVGLEKFLTASDGLTVENPRFLKAVQKNLRREQRALVRKVRGSKSRAKQRLKLARIHEKVANSRRDFHHKTANNLINSYGIIAVESLNIQGMLKNHRLARAISDASWGSFLIILKNKAENAGSQVVEVNARGTSQECSSCGEIVQKKLSCRVHSCHSCGYSAHRDLNAARNILQRSKILVGAQPRLDKVLVGELSTEICQVNI
jgi:putative transposase